MEAHFQQLKMEKYIDLYLLRFFFFVHYNVLMLNLKILALFLLSFFKIWPFCFVILAKLCQFLNLYLKILIKRIDFYLKIQTFDH